MLYLLPAACRFLRLAYPSTLKIEAKRQLTLNRLHDVVFQKTELFNYKSNLRMQDNEVITGVSVNFTVVLNVTMCSLTEK